MKFAAVLLACFAGALSLSFPEFVQKFERKYAANSTEWAMREAIFNTNVAQIESHNSNPQHGYTKAINQFADLTSDEMKVYLGYNKPAGRTFKGLKQMEAPVFHTRVEDLPVSVDWRKSVRQAFFALTSPGSRFAELYCILNLFYCGALH